MKTVKMLTMLVLALGLVFCLSQVGKAVPVGTAWTYQGRLMDANGPPDGLYDLQFALFSDPNRGSQIGPIIEVNDIDIIDGYFTVGLDFGSKAFGGDARWLEIGVRPWDGKGRYEILSPRQEVTPTPYALYTPVAGMAVDSIQGGGTSDYIAKFATADTIEDSLIYQSDNKIGIGTTGPQARVSIQMPMGPMSPIDVDGLVIRGALWNNGDQLEIQDAIGDTKIVVRGGRVGIGTASPEVGLHLKGAGWPYSFVHLEGDEGHDAGVRLYEGTMPKWHIFNSTADSGLRIYNSDGAHTVFFAEQTTGEVGIGTANPAAMLDVWSRGTYKHVIMAHASDGSELFSIQESSNGDGLLSLKDNKGNTQISLNSTTIFGSYMATPVLIGAAEYPPVGPALTIKGNLLVKSKITGSDILELGEGLDYAEGFDVTEENSIDPGSVLVIDSDNPGKLTVSRSAYDSKVAGIVAGAKGLGSGVRLGVGQFDHDVALAGRVYCNVDATQAAVEPGDLLTTSAVSGYAMKAIDYNRARGAILGKAMESLELGQKGQILVLVTLQ